MLELNQLKLLAKAVANADPSSKVAYSYGEEKLSYSELNETLRSELNALAGDYKSFRENKNTVFTIIETVVDEVLPKKVMQAYDMFAETKVFAQGDRPEFIIKTTEASRRRAKQFITKVGLAGVYEVFKLDGRTYEVPTSAFGGAAQIGLEEFLDGRVDFAELTEIVMEGLDEAIYKEIAQALISSIDSLQPANVHTGAGFSETEMDKLIAVADAYGNATIYCTYEFAVRMIPQEAWRYTEAMKTELWNTGRLASYKGTKVIILEQGFEDETNTTKVIDPGYAWVIPTGADGKPVKIAFEGGAIVDEYRNYDRSQEVQVYKKVGVRAIFSNAICVYRNTSLSVRHIRIYHYYNCFISLAIIATVFALVSILMVPSA